MYRNSYQRGMLTVLFSVGSNPLSIWGVKTTPDGYITRFLDQDIKSMVVELGATNVSTTYIYCPKAANVSLGISMPFLVMIVKNLRKYFSFEITILDGTGTRRRFRASNFQSTTQITPMCTVIPIGLSDGWNQIQFNLAEFTTRAYNKQFVEVQRIKINANIRIRRIYFAERLLPEDELPAEYKLFFPLQSKKAKTLKGKKEEPATEVLKVPSAELSTKPAEEAAVEQLPEPDKKIEVQEKIVQEDAVAVVGDMIEVMEDLVETKTEKGAEEMVTPASEAPDEPEDVNAEVVAPEAQAEEQAVAEAPAGETETEPQKDQPEETPTETKDPEDGKGAIKQEPDEVFTEPETEIKKVEVVPETEVKQEDVQEAPETEVKQEGEPNVQEAPKTEAKQEGKPNVQEAPETEVKEEVKTEGEPQAEVKAEVPA